MNSKNILATVIIIFGIGLILEEMSLIDFSIAQWWPLIIIGLGIRQLYSSKNVTSGLVFTTVGLILLAYQLNFIASFWSIMWPALLIIFGISLIIGKSRKKTGSCSSKHKSSKHGSGSVTAEDFDINCLMTSINETIDCNELNSGSASVVLGSAEVDLSRAVVVSQGAEIDLKCILGELTLIAPADCKIITKGDAILGSFSDKTFNSDSNMIAPVIRISYSVIMGEIKVFRFATENSEKIF